MEVTTDMKLLNAVKSTNIWVKGLSVAHCILGQGRGLGLGVG